MYSDLLELHIIELKKRLNGDSRLDDWIRLFNARTEEDLQIIRTKNAGVQKAKCMVQEMSLTETMREAVEYYRKKKMDRKSEDAYVYDQGKEAGERIGLERGERKVLFDLVLRGKLDIDTAAEACGLTPDEFKRKLAEESNQNLMSN